MKYCSNWSTSSRRCEGMYKLGNPFSNLNQITHTQDYHNQSRQDKHEQHQYQGYNNHNQNGYADRHDQQPRKGDNKKTWIIIAVIAVLLIALIVAFSVLKINFLRKSKHLILHKQLRKMTKSISQRSNSK